MVLVVYGWYNFLKKRIGYKIDYCDTCKDFTQCDVIRFLCVFHIYWIPILPLGIYRATTCHACGKPPRTAGCM